MKTLSEQYQDLINKLDPNQNKSVYDLLTELEIIKANNLTLNNSNELIDYSIKRLESQLTVYKKYLATSETTIEECAEFEDFIN